MTVNVTLSAYERWTWEKCGESILTLKNRLGYDDRLWVLGFELLDDGRLVDPFHGVEVFNPAKAGPPAEIPFRYNAVLEMYCLLSTYVTAKDIPLAGERKSLPAIEPIHPTEFSAEECGILLRYADRDWGALQAVEVPFFDDISKEGNFAFEVRPLPRVPLTIVLWQGDEDVSDSGTLLFDVSAKSYLPNMLVELAGLTVWRLKNILDPEVKWGHHQLAAAAIREQARLLGLDNMTIEQADALVHKTRAVRRKKQAD